MLSRVERAGAAFYFLGYKREITSREIFKGEIMREKRRQQRSEIKGRKMLRERQR